jgi:hypothetical protein
MTYRRWMQLMRQIEPIDEPLSCECGSHTFYSEQGKPTTCSACFQPATLPTRSRWPIWRRVLQFLGVSLIGAVCLRLYAGPEALEPLPLVLSVGSLISLAWVWALEAIH